MSEPLEKHQGLDSKVGVAVHEALLNDVAILLRLIIQLVL